jgi:hypothetical protein
MRNFVLSGVALCALVTPAMAADLVPSFKAPIRVYTWTGFAPGITTPATSVTWSSLNVSSGRAGLSYRF